MESVAGNPYGRNGTLRGAKFRVIVVSKVLTSVSEMIDAGHQVIFDNVGGIDVELRTRSRHSDEVRQTVWSLHSRLAAACGELIQSGCRMDTWSVSELGAVFARDRFVACLLSTSLAVVGFDDGFTGNEVCMLLARKGQKHMQPQFQATE